MYKKIITIILCVFTLIIMTQIKASADSGPKPSVVVKFERLEQDNCYVTLLSNTMAAGPHRVYNGNPSYKPNLANAGDINIWEKFVSYKDTDGFYFLQYFAKLDDNSAFKWGYFPPEEFKILLYFPETDSFMISDEIYERYAFDSYYLADAFGETIKVAKSYDYTTETVSLLARIVVTIAFELAIALMFGFRTKKQLLIIGTTNIMTQTILNILLNVINYNQGQLMFVINYVWLELLVFGIEAILYFYVLNKYSTKKSTKKWTPVLYALTANTVSFIAGLVLAHVIPGIF